MTHVGIGRQAEAQAATYLRSKGFKVLEQNWKTRWCEIDIVAAKDQRLYFVEVKYRESANQGQGLEYLTFQKLRQMRRAAEWYVSYNDWTGPYQLAAIEVSGPEFVITNFIVGFD